jgi:hypothetical protein
MSHDCLLLPLDAFNLVTARHCIKLSARHRSQPTAQRENPLLTALLRGEKITVCQRKLFDYRAQFTAYDALRAAIFRRATAWANQDARQSSTICRKSQLHGYAQLPAARNNSITALHSPYF